MKIRDDIVWINDTLCHIVLAALCFLYSRGIISTAIFVICIDNRWESSADRFERLLCRNLPIKNDENAFFFLTRICIIFRRKNPGFEILSHVTLSFFRHFIRVRQTCVIVTESFPNGIQWKFITIDVIEITASTVFPLYLFLSLPSLVSVTFFRWKEYVFLDTGATVEWKC